MEQEVKRSVGKPAREPLKKGSTSWTPASLNEFYNKEPGFRYRMVRKDPANLSKKSQEGWEIVSALNGSVTQQDPNRIEHGKPLTSVNEGLDWVLQRIPEELAQERDAYYNAETKRRTQGLTAHIKKDLGAEGATTHGEITISSRRG